MDEILDALVAIRHAQLGAAVGALGLDGFAVLPLVEVFGPNLLESFTLGSRGGFDCLRVGTRAAGPLALEAAQKLFVRVYETPPKIGTLLGALGEALGTSIAITVEEGRFALEPRLEVAFSGPFSTAEVFGVLNDLQVGPEVAGGFLGFAEQLMTTDVQEFGVALEHPRDAEPQFTVTFPWVHGPELRDVFASCLDAACETLAIPAALRQWFVAMPEALAPRAVNHTPVTVAFDHEQVLKRVTVTYPELPADLLLRLLVQFAPQENNGARLGALTAAVGLEEEEVSRLAVTVGAGPDPELRFELDAPGPPAIADA